jgi:hypothetical protein
LQIDVDLPVFGANLGFTEIRYRRSAELAEMEFECTPPPIARRDENEFYHWVEATHHVSVGVVGERVMVMVTVMVKK